MSNLFSNYLFFILFFVTAIGCEENKVIEKYSKATEDNIPQIEMGVAFDPSVVSDCADLLNASYTKGLCSLFYDGFERDQITGNNIFNWDVLVMDNGYGGVDVDASIENSAHLGHTIEGSRSALFRGRQGGSTHEIYLVSKPLDLTNFDQLYIQFRYIPINLEKEITLSWSGEKVPETIRIDVCNDSDYNCGLEGSNAYLRVRDNSAWDNYFLESFDYGDNYFLESFDYGDNLNIRNYVAQDWKLGQVLIDLSEYPDRKDKIVFKIAVSMDEGYIDNDHGKTMEDGLILDDVIALGVVKIEL